NWGAALPKPLANTAEAIFVLRNKNHFRRVFVATAIERSTTIAIYHCSIKIISRGKGKSAVAAAAYRAGEKIINEYDGVTHDYTKKGGVVHTEILLPDHAPAEYSDRAVLWNAVEKFECYKTAQLSREIELALPVELTETQNISLVNEYVNQHFVSAGMCADIAIHDKDDGNPHAHILLTMRPIEQDGKWGQKSRTVDGKKIPTVDWNEQTKAEEWREGWAVALNAHLEKHNHAERVDHRSYERQGVDKIPSIKLGTAAHQMEQKGVATDRGNINRAIEVTNQKLRELKAQIVKLQKWVRDIPKEPNLAEVVQSIFDRRSGIRHLKYTAEIVNFLVSNDIKDMAALESKLKEMYSTQHDIRNKSKPIERRLKVLDEHLRQVADYKKTKCPTSKAYLDRHLNGRKTIPTKAWRTERERLLADKQVLSHQYQKLKKETDQVYKIRRAVYDLVQPETRTPTRDMTR
ncbi:MAG: MobA/MobL family protein, partial [Oscillospiraceae bacterium]|nr:MobA/MobL family protein [Oscillospiraceae bacterium]